MNRRLVRADVSAKLMRFVVAITTAAVLLPVPIAASSSSRPQDQAAPAVKISADQLDSLVAPIALYPDNLLSQTLVASTYPLEIIQLQQWLEKNPNLAKDQKKLADAVKKQPWDPSIQAMAPLADVVKRLSDDIQWTTDLGNAFLAQQSDVMEAIQRMRNKAKGTGALADNQQQNVEVKTVETKQVIVIEQSNPQVIYVPSYNPTVVYGAPVYPYPPIYYPPSTGAVIAASAISFGVGLAVGAAWGGGWGWGCGWGHNDININVNNNLNRNTNISGGNRVNNIQGGNKWQSSIGSGNRGGGGGDRVGDRSVGGGSGGGRSGGFGGGSGGFNGASARSSSSRGSSSMGGFGGGSRGGGGGGGSRGGGGGRGGSGGRR